MTRKDELTNAVTELKNEVKQIREIVNMLFVIVMESEMMEEEELSPDFPLGGPQDHFTSGCN